MRSDEDQKTTTLGGILAEEIHKTPSKTLAGDDSNATARPLTGPRQDPCRGRQRATARPLPGHLERPLPSHPTRRLPGRQQGHCQARTNHIPAAVRMQLPAQPAGQAPAWQHAASRPTQQAPAWRHADLREDPSTVPPQLPACLHGATRIAGQGACRSEEERRRTGRASLPSPIK